MAITAPSGSGTDETLMPGSEFTEPFRQTLPRHSERAAKSHPAGFLMARRLVVDKPRASL